jgi:methylglutaconyl-CoA hydratase
VSVHYQTIKVSEDRPGVLEVVLARPDARNAFNAEVIREIADVFSTRARSAHVRVVVIRGEGPSFCAGADLNWMKASAALGYDENIAESRRMAEMFESIAFCPAPVVAFVHGHALGGGSGLVAAADVAFADEKTKFGFTEVKLGIIPAVISPFVVRKIGQTHARRWFTSGAQFDGKEAERIGLVARAADEATIKKEFDAYLEAVLASGPIAVREAKKLIDKVILADPKEAADITVPWIARLRSSPEGQEGMSAFFAKRPPNWASPTK